MADQVRETVDGVSREVLLVKDVGAGASGTLSAEYNLTPPVLADEDETPLQTNSSGDLKVEITNEGDAVSALEPLNVAVAGSTNHRLLSAAGTTNATSVKGTAGKLYKMTGKVARASEVFLKLYNKATAADETDTPVFTIALPPSSWFDLDYGGFAFATGISYRFTTAGADNSTGALTAGDIIGFNLTYA